MSKIFVSHSSVNNPQAIAISQWLDEHGWSDHFLDITTTRGLSPGEHWQEALKAAANRCEAVLFLISQPWLDSKWCLAEFLLAKSLGKNIFGVLIEDLDLATLPIEMTGEYQLCDLVHGDERNTYTVTHDPLVLQTQVGFSKAGLENLKNGLNKSGLEANSFPWPPRDDPDRTPYRGLKPLNEKDAAIYFGRDAEIIRGLDELRKIRELGINKILVILGASGAGKSSFLGAGLLPRLKRDDRHFLTLPIIRPGRDALNGDRGLLAALEDAFAGYELTKTRGQIRSILEKPEGMNELLQALLETSMKQQAVNAPRPTILIPIDQCEELYSSDIQASKLFRSYLGQVLLAEDPQTLSTRTKPHIIAVVTIRTDLYENLQTDPAFSGIQQQLYNLTPLAPTEYKDIIEGPAEQATKAGNPLEIEAGLTEKLLTDAKGADALPLLAFTLEHLFVEHGRDGDLTLDEYRSVGGIQGAVGLAVNAALSEPETAPVIPSDESQQKQLLRSAFIPWLAEIDENTGEHKRRIAKWDELPTQTHPVVERLIDLRLLTRDKRKTTADGSEDIIVEVAHEALLRRWPLLSQWLEEDADELRIISAIAKSVTAWQNNDYDDEYLDHKGERLQEAENIQNREDLRLRLGDTGQAYIKRCRYVELERIDNEKRQLDSIKLEQNKTRKYQKRVTYILGIVSLLITAIGYWVYEQALDTSEQVSKMLVNESQHAVKANLNQHALKLALLATRDNWRTNATPSATANLAGIAQNLRLESQLNGHTGTVIHASFNPAGKHIVTASEDNSARIWSVSTREPIGAALQHEDELWQASFNPAGTRIVTASRDHTARIWDATTGDPIGVALQHKDAVTHASFNLAGTQIVTSSKDNTARIWDASTGISISTPLQHEDAVTHASFNPAGTHIVTASEDKTARIWAARTGKPIGETLQHEEEVWHVSFNPAGTRIVTASRDNTARIWDASTGNPINAPLQHEDTVLHASFNMSGTQIVTASKDKTARIWDASTGEPIGTKLQHEDEVWYASFNLAGTHIVTASKDNTARIWDASTGESIGAPLQHKDVLKHVSFNPTGMRIVTTSRDHTARIWEVRTGKSIGAPLQHEDEVWHASFNPAGTRIVTASRDKTARIWDTSTGKPIGGPLQHKDALKHASFNPAGTRIVTSSRDKTARIWDASTGKPVGAPLQHGSTVRHTSFNPAGTHIITAARDHTARIWSVSTSEPIGVPLQHEDELWHACFNPAGTRIVTASRDKTARIWDASTGEPVAAPLQHEDEVWHASFNQTGSRIVTASRDHTARIWNASSGEPIGTPFKHNSFVRHADFNPTGTRIVTASRDHTARIWDASTGESIGAPLQHKDEVWYASFNPAGTRIVTASEDNTARIWDASTGEPIGAPLQHKDALKRASFNPAGTHIVTASEDNTARIWDVTWLVKYNKKADLIRAVCQKWGSDVTTLTESDINEPLIPRDRVGEDTCPSHN